MLCRDLSILLLRGLIILSELKKRYSKERQTSNDSESFRLNSRLLNTYKRITFNYLNIKLSGKNIDLGCGDGGFSKACINHGIDSVGLDYMDVNFENEKIDADNESIDFITMNAVLEHISNPEHILKEAFRLLKKGGLIIIRTPNFQMDYKNFYNDPTHVKPYTPKSLKTILEIMEFNSVFCEPGLIEKRSFWWKLPEYIKWKVASKISGGTNSIIILGAKKM